MKALWEAETGATVTVRKVTGGRERQKRMEQLGIMAGSDLTVLGKTPAGTVRVSGFRQEIELEPEDAKHIGIGAHFVRNGDPILLCGCCASGNTGEILDRMERYYEERERQNENA